MGRPGAGAFIAKTMGAGRSVGRSGMGDVRAWNLAGRPSVWSEQQGSGLGRNTSDTSHDCQCRFRIALRILLADEYGDKFLLVAGLLNYLAMLDAFDIAAGRKR